MKLADCARVVEKYDAAIKILKTALQYAWNFNLKEKELMIYDQMGMVYFHLGDMKKAKYYHKRYII